MIFNKFRKIWIINKINLVVNIIRKYFHKIFITIMNKKRKKLFDIWKSFIMNNFYLYLLQMNENKLYSNEYNEDKFINNFNF